MPKNKDWEIVSLNREFISFDADDISIENLEQRLELQMMLKPPPCPSKCYRM